MESTNRITTIVVGRYETAAGERELVLTDLTSFGGIWTLLDVDVGAPFAIADARLVATWLYNFADAGQVADVYLERSRELGYPAVNAGFDEWEVPVLGTLRERIREARCA